MPQSSGCCSPRQSHAKSCGTQVVCWGLEASRKPCGTLEKADVTKKKKKKMSSCHLWDILFTRSAHPSFPPISFLSSCLHLFYLLIVLIVSASPCPLHVWSESQLTSMSAGGLWYKVQCIRPPCRTLPRRTSSVPCCSPPWHSVVVFSHCWYMSHTV